MVGSKVRYTQDIVLGSYTDYSTLDVRSYLPPVQIGEVMRGTGVGRIVASKNPMFKAGDLATGICGWRELTILGEKEIWPPQLAPGQQLLPELKVHDLAGVLSMQFGRYPTSTGWH